MVAGSKIQIPVRREVTEAEAQQRKRGFATVREGTTIRIGLGAPSDQGAADLARQYDFALTGKDDEGETIVLVGNGSKVIEHQAEGVGSASSGQEEPKVKAPVHVSIPTTGGRVYGFCGHCKKTNVTHPGIACPENPENRGLHPEAPSVKIGVVTGGGGKPDDESHHFEEFAEDKAQKIVNVVGGNIYSCWTPPEARGVWFGCWATVVAHYPKVVGQERRTIRKAVNSFPRAEEVRIRQAD